MKHTLVALIQGGANSETYHVKANDWPGSDSGGIN